MGAAEAGAGKGGSQPPEGARGATLGAMKPGTFWMLLRVTLLGMSVGIFVTAILLMGGVEPEVEHAPRWSERAPEGAPPELVEPRESTGAMAGPQTGEPPVAGPAEEPLDSGAGMDEEPGTAGAVEGQD